MLIKEQEYELESGERILIKSAQKEDGAALKELREITSQETHFMAREPEDGPFDITKTCNMLEALEKSEREFTVTAFYEGKIVGDLGVMLVKPHLKYLHRAALGMSIRQGFCGKGLGTFMLEIALKQARENGFEQIELDVYSENKRAIHTYEKVGFVKVGVIPKAFKLLDGTYQDEILMVKRLNVHE